MNTVASRQNFTRQPVAQPTTKAIVPGDKIAIKSNAFTVEDVVKAAQKRWRQSLDPTAQVFKDHVVIKDTLQESVQDLLRWLVRCYGEKDLILTPEELKARSFKMNVDGIMKALVQLLKKGPATANEIKFVVRQQVGMRRIPRDPDTVGSRLIHHLKYNGYLYLTHKGREDAWGLAKEKQITEDKFVEIFPEGVI